MPSAAIALAGALLQFDAAAERLSISYEQITALPPNEAAALFLEPDAAANIVAKQVSRDPYLSGGVTLRFFTRARPVGTRLCRREQHEFSAVEAWNGELLVARSTRTYGEAARPQLRLASQCDGIAGAQFASVQPGSDVAEAAEILEWLGRARDFARAHARLPLRVNCKSKAKPERCTAGAREALAALPLEKAFAIGRVDERPEQWELFIPETRPGDVLWTVTVDRSRAKAKVHMLWHYPAPF